LNEIGGNKFLVEEGEERLLLDFGTPLGGRSRFFEEFLQPRGGSILRDLLRLDLLPFVDGVYRDDLLELARVDADGGLPESAARMRARTGRAGVDAILITHAHVDHFQDLSFVDPAIPVFASATTWKMLQAIQDISGYEPGSEILGIRRRSLGEYGKTASFPGTNKIVHAPEPRAVRVLPELLPSTIAGFEVVPVPVDHSVPGGCAYIVRSPAGKVLFYTGDVRFHGSLHERTAALLKAAGDLSPDVMLCEGTRIHSENRDNEADVRAGITTLVKDTPGLAIAEFAWKDITRFDTLAQVAADTGRQLLVDPRLAYLLNRLHGEPGVPSRSVESYGGLVGVYLRRKESMLYQPGDYEKHEVGYSVDWTGDQMGKAWRERDEAFLADRVTHWRRGKRAADVAANPSKYIVHLTFWTSSELLDIAPPAGSSWIRCATEPYSPDMTLDQERQRNWLDHFGLRHNVRGAREGAEGLLAGTTHVSGHGARPDLRRLVELAKPKVLVPIHVDRKNLDRYDGWAADIRRFPDARAHDVAHGRVVVEVP
jgi:ribonuclease J